MQVTRVKVQSENANEPKITIEAKSFYQPAKNFNIKTETVK
jgi:hypothetical protein